MYELTNSEKGKTFSSLYLVEQINIYRKEEGGRADLLHKSLLSNIEKEFDEEITGQNILPSSYLAGNGKQEKCYELTFEQSLQMLMKESKIVRKQVIEVLKRKQTEIEVPQTYSQALLEAGRLAEQNERLLAANNNLSVKLDLLTDWVSIIKVAHKNKVKETAFNWRSLKSASIDLGYEIKKAESPRYGYQNLYHVNAFKFCYPKYDYNFNNSLIIK